MAPPFRTADGQGPSPAAYAALARRWSTAYAAWAAQVYLSTYQEITGKVSPPTMAGIADLPPMTQAEAETAARHLAKRFGELVKLPPSKGGPPAPPPQTQIEAVGRPALRRALVESHRDLVAVGMPPGYVVSKVDPKEVAALVTRGDAAPIIAPPIPGGRAPRVAVPGIRGRAQPRPLAPTAPKPAQAVPVIDILEAGPGKAVLEAWARAGVELIQAVPVPSVQALQSAIVRTAAGGARWEDLARDVQGMTGSTASHARLIAQDQVAKLNSAVTQSMHEAAGVTEYRWRTSGDQRVRASHRAVNGLTFKWGDPAKGAGAPKVGFYGENGHPGQCGRCRCRAEPVVTADWMSEDYRPPVPPARAPVVAASALAPVAAPRPAAPAAPAPKAPSWEAAVIDAKLKDEIVVTDDETTMNVASVTKSKGTITLSDERRYTGSRWVTDKIVITKDGATYFPGDDDIEDPRPLKSFAVLNGSQDGGNSHVWPPVPTPAFPAAPPRSLPPALTSKNASHILEPEQGAAVKVTRQQWESVRDVAKTFKGTVVTDTGYRLEVGWTNAWQARIALSAANGRWVGGEVQRDVIRITRTGAELHIGGASGPVSIQTLTALDGTQIWPPK